MIKTVFAVFVFLLVSQFAVAAPPLEAYGRLPAVEMMRMSPSGERYTVIGVAGEARRFMVMNVKGEALISGDLGDTKVRDIQWIGDDRVLI